MTIPTASNYPKSLDNDENLFLVHDALRLRLIEDYLPGQTHINVEGDATIMARIPSSGLITLTEQCSELDKRAISFWYASFDSSEGKFSGLELLDGFKDYKKPKRITNVTINVMAKHHNHIKDSVIAIEKFLGKKGEEDKEPFGDTLEGRLNFLRRLVLKPKAWFSADQRVGTVPLTVEFEDMSFRLGSDGNSGDTTITWDFGDQTMSTISTISATTDVPDSAINVYVEDTDGGKIKKTYHQPGIYDVKLTVENDFGSESVVFPELIKARVKAPDPAIIRFIGNTSSQETTAGVPPNGPFDQVPTIRSPINTLINIEIPSGENPATPGVSYSGETLDNGSPVDAITDYSWFLGDDLPHPNTSATKAAFSVGGIYDLKLRVDTEFGAYRITTYEDSIDIVENQNLWLWTLDGSTASAYEYGLISETFKLSSSPSFSMIRNDSFLDNVPNSEQQKREFRKNTGFAPRTTTFSGQGGTALLYWASGRNEADPASNEVINVVEFNGFSGTYTTHSSIQRQWNWANFNTNGTSYFVFGAVDSHSPNTSFTNTLKQEYDLTNLSVCSSCPTLAADNYLNGASELEQNPAVFDSNGDSVHGHFSVYRTTWKDDTGYLARNDGVGPFFRIKSFYRTEGTLGNPFTNIRKLQDIQGPTKLEGELTNLSTGIYMLNNSGSVSKFSDTSGSWSTGGPGVNSSLYRTLQDSSVSGFDDSKNTLLLTSDGDKRAYLSFDYSPEAFIKFRETDLTFVSLGNRPSGEQWIMGVW